VGYFSTFPDHDYAKIQIDNYLLKRLPEHKTNYGRERLGGGPSAEAVIGVFNPQLKLMNNDWFKCTLQPRRALKKLRKLNPALLLPVQSLGTFSVKYIADKHQVHTEGCIVGKMLRARVAYQRCITIMSNRKRVARAH
jgi:hypothetical protein